MIRRFAWFPEILAAATAVLLCILAPASGQENILAADIVFQNPSFEEDVENDGVPEGWDIPESTRVNLVVKASHGAKAALFTDGYVIASQNFAIRDLAGRQLVVAVDAKGSDGAAFGCLVGCFRKLEDTPRKFVYSRLAWDRPLPATFERVTMRYRFPANCLDGRVWIAFYRSNRQGSVWLDNATASAQSLDESQRLELTRLARELTYLGDRAALARGQYPDHDTMLSSLVDESRSLAERCRNGDPDVRNRTARLAKTIPSNHARINRLTGTNPVLLSRAFACDRLPPAAPLPRPLDGLDPLALQGEVVALGAVLYNTTEEPQELTLTISAGAALRPDVEIRRQVFMETWYKKAETRLADPLPRLPRRGSHWSLTLPPGGVEKLYIGLHTRADVASSDGRVTLTATTAEGLSTRAAWHITILPVPMPDTPKLQHLQFIYPDKEPAGSHPEVVAADLAAHRVSAIEFPYIPKVTFHPDGRLASADFEGSQQARWLQAYGKTIDRLAIFWEGRYARLPIDGKEETYLPHIDDQGNLTPEFMRAYRELLSAWLEFARAQGFDSDRFIMLPDDEPSSREDFADAPGKEVRRACELYKLTRDVAPELLIGVTLSDYAGPADAALIAEHVDVVMPVWPYRENLTRWAPKDYNPRKAFHETILPGLQKHRREDGLSLWSYRVDRGKSAAVMESARGYPCMAVGAGFTGIATWAYNVARGSSWDDTDGGLLDYILVYDGTEEHPLNRQVNPTGEIVVPSIRWEAMRIGWQDGQILLHLKDWAREHHNSALAQDITRLSDRFAEWAKDPSLAEYEPMRQASRQLRSLMKRKHEH